MHQYVHMGKWLFNSADLTHTECLSCKQNWLILGIQRWSIYHPCPHKSLGSCPKAIDLSFLRLMGHVCHQCWELTSYLLQSFQQFIFFRNTSDRELMVFYSYAYFLIFTNQENSDLFFSCLFPCIFWETLFIIFS